MLTDVISSGCASFILTVMVGVLAYIAFIYIFRLTGKRSLVEINTFDMIVMVIHASIIGTMLLSESYALVDGIISLALLLFVHFEVTWLSARFTSECEGQRSEASLVYHNEAFVDEAMQRQHVSRNEVVEPIVTSVYFRNRKRAPKKYTLASPQSNRNTASQSKMRHSKREIVRN